MNRRLYVNATGFAAPGLGSFADLSDHFSGTAWRPNPDWQPASTRLAPRQARRLSDATRLAIMAAEQIAEAVPHEAAWVFASSAGEGWALNEILSALSQPEIMVQPLRFQNSVHNAALGQWSILAGATGPATSIAAFDETVGAGFLKAVMQAQLEQTAIGLVLFDAPLPPPLHEKRKIDVPMAAALALTPWPSDDSQCVLEFEHLARAAPSGQELSVSAEALLDSGNPVRFVLPLLERIDRMDPAPVVLALPGGGGLRVSVGEASDAQ
jgi:hypothetical protein